MKIIDVCHNIKPFIILINLFSFFFLFSSLVVNGTHESARGTPVCPLGVLQALRGAGWVVPADQQDAHELLHVLLSCIEEETAAMSKKVKYIL